VASNGPKAKRIGWACAGHWPTGRRQRWKEKIATAQEISSFWGNGGKKRRVIPIAITRKGRRASCGEKRELIPILFRATEAMAHTKRRHNAGTYIIRKRITPRYGGGRGIQESPSSLGECREKGTFRVSSHVTS